MGVNHNPRRQDQNAVLGVQAQNNNNNTTGNTNEQIADLLDHIIKDLEGIRDLVGAETTTTTTTTTTTNTTHHHCRDNEVNRILAQIEANNPRVMDTLVNEGGFTPNEARRIIRTIIRLTLKYEN